MRLLVLVMAIALHASAMSQEQPQSILDQANAAYLARRPLEAAELYRQFLRRDPNRADVRTYLGAALLSAGHVQDALDEAKSALSVNPDYGRAHVLIGRIYAGQQRWRDAQEQFDIARRIDPRDREASYFSGRAYYEENRFEQAIAAFKRAQAMGAEQSRICENLGLSYEALGKEADAEKSYRRAIQLAGAGEYRPFLAYGTFLLKSGRLEEGLPLLEKAVSIGSKAPDARFELGRALLEAGQLEKAGETLESALAFSDDCRFRYLLIKVYTRLGRTIDARRHLASTRNCQMIH